MIIDTLAIAAILFDEPDAAATHSHSIVPGGLEVMS
jgi:uncharacterized protein with PIN domain